MKPNVVIVRMGELTLKGRNRYKFEAKIIEHARALLADYPTLDFRHEFGRLYIYLNDVPFDHVAKELDKLFGLRSYSPAIGVKPDADEIQLAALDIFRNSEKKPATFKAEVKRSNKNFPYNSLQMADLIGRHVLKNTPGLSVDVHQPECIIRADIRNEEAFVYTEVFPGAGGFPLGMNGKGLLLLSGGIDSPVAGWLSMRMGMEVEAVHFHSYPYTSERAKRKVLDLAKQLSNYCGKMVVHMVPFTDIQVKLRDNCPEHLLVILMKRMMMRIAERLAEKRKAGALITGESLGQVASQTLVSLSVIEQPVSMMVLRPLVTMEKAEIMRVAERIGTFPISIQPYEDCCTLFLPKSPVIHPDLKAVQRVEGRLNWLEDAIQAAVKGTERIVVECKSQDELDELFG